VALILSIAILAWWRATRRPWSELGFVRPRLRSLFVAIVFGAALKLLLKAIVLPLLGASDTNQAFSFLYGNTAALPGMIVAILLVAGFGEEIVYRGFLFDRFSAWWGRSRVATHAAIVVAATLFGLAHWFEQGWQGVLQGTIVGVIFGGIYARTRSLVPLMAAHIAFDLVALAIIYLGWETRVAHLLF
jgi:membrane protease YdiL (CAAX protease family)